MISKPFLIIGAILGTAGVSVGGYYGISSLTSKRKPTNSEPKASTPAAPKPATPAAGEHTETA